MSLSRYLVLTVVLAGAHAFVVAQDPQGQEPSRSTPAPALTGIVGLDTAPIAENDSNSLPQIPSILGGRGPSLTFISEQERSNYLRAGLNVGASYDDNALLTPSGQLSNTAYNVFPNIDISQTFSRLRWDLGYAAGITVNQRLSNRNEGSHNLTFDSEFRLSSHVSMRLAENFSITTGMFDSGSGYLIGNGGPNDTILTPLATQRSSSTTAEADYHFARRDIAGVSGSFYDLHYSNVSDQVLLTDTRTSKASAFWLHGLGRYNWIGGSYQFQHLTFTPDGITNDHSFLIVDTLALPSRLSLSGFAGPEGSNTRSSLPGSSAHSRNLSAAFGAEGSWHKEHTSVTLGFSRRLSDGGGVLGVVRLQQVHGYVRQELRPGWALGLSGSYGHNNSLAIPVGGNSFSINSTSVGASLERNLGSKLGVHLGYSHDFQDEPGTGNSLSTHRNRVFVTLGYQWTKPLGQ